MKKAISILLIIVVTLVITCLVVFYLLKRNALKQFEEKNIRITLIWESFYQKNTKRLLSLDSLSVVNDINCNKDSLCSAILKNVRERNIKEVDALWLLEYNTNKQYLKTVNCYAEKTILKEKLKSLQNNANELNQILEQYNTYVKEFNVFYSTFPNLFFARDTGFKRKKYFDLKFGVDNEALFLEKKRIKNWIETGELTN